MSAICGQQTFSHVFSRREQTLSRTIRIKNFQVQDLIGLQSSSNAPSAFFQKRERTLKNPSCSILAIDASLIVSITDATVRMEIPAVGDKGSGNAIEELQLPGCPFEFLNSVLAAHANVIDYKSLPSEIAFASGMIGYLGFGLTGRIENIQKQKNNPFNVPDSMTMLPQTVIYIDHANNSIHLISRAGRKRFQSLLALVEKLNDTAKSIHGAASHIPLPGPSDRNRPNHPNNRNSNGDSLNRFESGFPIPGSNYTGLSASMSKEQFIEKAGSAKKLIEEGQCFQIVLSQRFSAATSITASEMITTLLETAPSTYNYYLNFPDFQYVGASPETMISAKGGQVRLCALAGTRPRGTTSVQDDRNEVELRTNEKELAEHLMLVDLGRNDLGKVCAPGSIKLGPVAQVLKYSNVMHLGTEIFGTLELDNTPLKALKACFPRGTVSGAPKVRALEVLSQLEPEQRGIYAGAVGFFDGRGNMDTAIAIRSALLKDSFIHINAGAGIVYDSEPEFEYLETINKASAMARVFQQANSEDSLRAGAR